MVPATVLGANLRFRFPGQLAKSTRRTRATPELPVGQELSKGCRCVLDERHLHDLTLPTRGLDFLLLTMINYYASATIKINNYSSAFVSGIIRNAKSSRVSKHRCP